jgi:myosin heavy subunit
LFKNYLFSKLFVYQIEELLVGKMKEVKEENHFEGERKSKIDWWSITLVIAFVFLCMSMSRLCLQNEELLKENRNSREEVAELRVAIKNLMDIVTVQGADIKELKNINLSLLQKNEELKTEMEKLLADNSEWKKKTEELLKQNAEFEKKMEKLLAENSALRDKVDELQKQGQWSTASKVVVALAAIAVVGGLIYMTGGAGFYVAAGVVTGSPFLK